MAVDNLTNIYVADNGNRAIRKVSPDGFVTTLAGGLDFKGIKDGQGASASFVSPVAIAADNAGNVYVTDSGTIRRVTPEGTVTTLAGAPGVVRGADGIGSLAQFSEPFAIAVDSAGPTAIDDMYQPFRELLTLLLGNTERPVLIAKVAEIQRLLDPLLYPKKRGRNVLGSWACRPVTTADRSSAVTGEGADVPEHFEFVVLSAIGTSK